MPIFHTSVDRVNFRSGPELGENKVGSLYLAQEVEVTGDQEGDRWLPARATIEGAVTAGFVSKNVLRDPLSGSKEALVQETVKQWLRFHRGTKKEYQTRERNDNPPPKYVNTEPYIDYVGEFWQSIGVDLDGLDRDVPWSAAFISYVVREAGGYDGFVYSAAHARYCHKAIRAKLDDETHPFWGFRIADHKPQLGDMVCRWRQKKIDYDHAASTKYYKIHCDIVVQVADDHVFTIGGNVSHSVRHTKYAIDNSGFLTGEGNVYAVLRNNL